MLGAFEDAAPEMMLFLRTVAEIEIYRWDADAAAPSLVHATKIAPIARKDKSSGDHAMQKMLGGHNQRDGIQKLPQPLNLSAIKQYRDYTATAFMDITSATYDSWEGGGGGTSGVPQKSATTTWLVRQALGDGTSMELATSQLATQYEVSLLPWGGIAMRIDDRHEPAPVDGRAYVFLPLPAQTGLPVHINGFFEVSENRRDVWYGNDMHGAGKFRSDWNVALLSDVIARTYADILLQCATNGVLDAAVLGSGQAYYAMLPNIAAMSQPWTAVAARVYHILHGQCSVVCNGRWTAPAEEVVFVDQASPAATSTCLVNILARSGLSICSCPAFVPHGFAAAGCAVTVLTPELVRQHFRKYDAPHMSVEESADVLKFLLSDGCGVAALHGLDIFPAADGSVRAIGPGKQPMLVARNALEYQLIEGSGSIILHSLCCLDAIISTSLAPPPRSSPASGSGKPVQEPNGLTQLTLKVLRNHVLETLLPRAWHVDLAPGMQQEQKGPHPGAKLACCRDWKTAMPAPRGRGNSAVDAEGTGAWIRTFWKVMNILLAQAGVPCEEALLPFSNLLLLPGEDGNLYPARTPSPFHACAALVPETSSDEDAAALANCLRSLGVTAVAGDYYVPSSVVVACSNNGTPTGAVDSIMHAFGELAGHPPPEAFAQCSQLERVALLRFCCSTPHSFNSTHLAFLALVPFLQTHHPKLDLKTAAPLLSSPSSPTSGSGDAGLGEACGDTLSSPMANGKASDQAMVAANGSAVVCAPADYSSELLGSKFVKFVGFPGEETLLKLLGVKQMPESQFVMRIVLPAISSQQMDATVRDVTMIKILTSGLPTANAAVAGLLTTTKFVPTKMAGLQAPADLYDPTVKEITALLSAGECYPEAPYATNPELLQVLRFLGLRMAVNLSALASVAGRVAELSECEEKSERAVALLSYIDDNANSLFGLSKKKRGMFSRMIHAVSSKREEEEEVQAKDFFARVAGIAWIPVLSQKPTEHLPWPSIVSGDGTDADAAAALSTTAVPADCRLGSDIWLASASRRIVAIPIRSDFVREHLGLLNKIPARVAANQIIAWEALATSSRDGALAAPVSRHMPELYAVLNAACLEDPAGFRRDAAPLLEDRRWVWTGSGDFVDQARVALRSRVDCRPYLHTLDASIAHAFSALFSAVGIKGTFEAADFANVLVQLHANYAAGAENDEDDVLQEPSRPLETGDLNLALAALHQLVECASPPLGETAVVPVPDAHGCMCPGTMLVYNDSVWQPPTQHRLVHQNISNAVAAAVGIKSLIQHVLSPSMTDDLEAYGQEESLTSRLAGLLEVYPDGPSIFKELVQNADDAGASVVHVVLDAREWAATSLLGDSMAPWNGPAVCVYNDATFKQKDFASLASLANSSKFGDVGSTGRFGCGWNSVYHFTDVPSIVSGEHVVFLDPHRKYLPGTAGFSRPGMKIRFVGTRIKEQFPDQFQPFCDFFGCDMTNRFDGTLFRFPLRTAALAAASEIKSGQPYTLNDIRTLFAAFHEHLAELLIFLKNVKSVVVSEVGDGGEMRELYSTHVKQSTDLVPASSRAEFDAFFRSDGGQSLSHAQLVGKLGTLPLQMQHAPSAIQVKNIHVRRADTPEANIATWLVSSVVGGPDAIRIACQEDLARLKLVPVAGVAARVAGVPSVGRAFVFLPLPVETNLPVHVNGCFEISSNRRDLWSGGDMTGDGQRRSKWNETLLEDGVGLAWSTLVKAAQGMDAFANPGLLEDYYRLFPLSVGVAKPWTFTVKGFYTNSFRAPVLSQHVDPTAVVGNVAWIRPCDAVFLPEPEGGTRATTSDSQEHLSLKLRLKQRRRVHSLHQDLASALLKFGVNIPSCPQRVVEEFIRHIPNEDLKLATPAALRAMLKAGSSDALDSDERSCPSFLHIGGAGEAEACIVLQHLVSDLDSGFDDLLGITCCPLMDGGWATVSSKGTAPPLYVCTTAVEFKLLEFATTALVHECVISDQLAPHFLHEKFLRMSQLEILTHTSLATLLREHLPEGWASLRPQPERQWLGGQVGAQPSYAWLGQLWQHLDSSLDTHNDAVTSQQPQHLAASAIMKEFAGLTLIPGSDGALYPIQPMPCASFPVTCKAGLPPDVATVLLMLGCVLSKDDHEHFVVPNRLLHTVANPADQHGVLRALLHNLQLHVDGDAPAAARSMALQHWFGRCKVEPSHRRALFNFFAAGDAGFSQEERNFLGELPIFEVYTKSSDPAAQMLESATGEPAINTAPQAAPTASMTYNFTSISECQRGEGLWIPPPGIPRVLLSSLPFVKTAAASTHSAFLNSLGVDHMSLPLYLSNTGFAMLGSLKKYVRDEWIVDILRNVRVDEQTSSGWFEELRSTAFVPNGSGNLCKPSELYHPRVPEVFEFLGRDSCYPAPTFTSPDLLEILASLGLRDHAGAEAFLQGVDEIAGAVHEAAAPGNDVASVCKRAEHLVKFLDAHAEEFCAQKILQDARETIRSKCWLPVLRQPTHELMPWCEHGRHLGAPDKTRPGAQAWLVSSECQVASIDVTSPAAMQLLGWDNDPCPQTLACQLAALSKQAATQVGAWGGADSTTGGGDTASSAQGFRAHASAAVFQIYSLLSASTVTAQPPNDIARILQGAPWIWIGQETQITAERFAFDHVDGFSSHGKPWLYTFADLSGQWEDENSDFTPELTLLTAPFFKWVGARDTFVGTHYTDVLMTLVTDARASAQGGAGAGGLRVHPPHVVQFAVEVAQACANHGGSFGSRAQRELLVPTKDGQLVPRHAVTYNDAAWMDSDSAAGFDFVHPDISNEIALALGIKSLQSMLNANIEFCSSLHCPALDDLAPVLSRFSQVSNEDVVVDVMYDLLEVADRLGCQSASIVLDERKLSKQSVFQPSLREVHENALVVFLPGVTLKPEEVSSLIDPRQCRSFRHPQHEHSIGPGLSAAFRITDVVTVLSGEHLSFFDPSATYVKMDLSSGAGANQPSTEEASSPVGKSYAFGRSRLMYQFPDQFNVFEMYGFDGSSAQAFPNTIFRFPLRGDAATQITQRFSHLANTLANVRSALQRLQASRVQPLLFAAQLNRLSIETLHTRDTNAQEASASEPNVGRSNDVVGQAARATTADGVETDSSGHVQTLLSKVSVRPGQDLSSRTLLADTHSWKSRFSLRGAVHKKVGALYTLIFDVIESGDDALPFEEAWSVSMSLACPAAQDLSYHDELRHRYLKPVIGVAYNLSRTCNDGAGNRLGNPPNYLPARNTGAYLRREATATDDSADSSEGSAAPVGNNSSASTAGRILCASPCTEVSGFEMHVYGYFAKRADGYLVMENQNQSSRLVAWNQLLADSLADPMASVLQRLSHTRDVERNPMLQYAAWPKPNAVHRLFKAMCTSLYRKLAGMHVFFKANGQRCGMSEGHFLTQSANPLVREYLCGTFASMIEIDSECLDQLVEADSKRSMFQRKACHKLTPERLRNHVRSTIKSAAHLKAASSTGADATFEGQAKLASQLIQFCASDLHRSGSSAQKDALRGLCLLPLSNNEVAELGTVQAVMATELEQKLLPSDSVRFCHPAMTAMLRSSQEDKALLNTVGVKEFSPSFIAYHMHDMVPRHWKGQRSVSANDAQELRCTEWFQLLWSYITKPEGSNKASVPATITEASAAAADSRSTPTSTQAAASPARAANAAAAAARCDAVCLDWPLLPTQDGGLSTVRSRKATLPPATMCHADAAVLGAVNQLGCVCLAEDFPECVEVLGGAPPENDPEFDLWPTYFLQKLAEVHLLASVLPEESAAALCAYFSAAEASLEASPRIKETLRRLPMYETASGESRVAVANGSCTFDPAICSAFQPPPSNGYLKYSPNLIPLYSFVEVPVLSETEVLTKCVESFSELGETEKDAMIESLILRWRSLGDAAAGIAATLRDVPCIVNALGERVVPRTCVDTHNALLRCVFGRSNEVLPNEERYPRSNAQCWEVLRELGVRHRLDTDLFLLCCQHVSDKPSGSPAPLGSTAASELLKASRELLLFLRANLSNFQSQEFYVQLKEIRMIALAFRGNAHLFSFGEVSVERDEDLVGFVRPALPADMCPPQVFWNKLGITSPPPPDAVVENIQAISNSCLDSWPIAKPVEAVFERIYEHLSDRLERLSLPLKVKLQSIPLIPVHHLIVPTSRVFLRLSDQMAPWIFELPRRFAVYDKFFVELGMQATLATAAVVEIVEGIAQEKSGTTLNPTELRAFIRLLEHLAAMLAAEPLARGLARLYVPDTLSVLVPIRQCVFMDATLSSQHVAAAPFLVASPLLTTDICLAIGMKPMSTVVAEELVSRPSAGKSSIETRSVPPGMITALKSMVSVMPHESEFSEQSQLQKIAQLAKYTINVIPTVEVVCRVRKTRAQLGPKADRRCFFVERSLETIWIASTFMDGVSYQDALAGAMNQIVSPRAPLALAPLLRCGAEHVQLVMDALAYRSPQEHGHVYRGTPGEPLLDIDAALLKMSPARQFHDREIVAFKDADAYFYGRIIKKPIDDAAGADTGASSNASTTAYGGLQAHTVEVGSGKCRRLLPSEVWAFRTDTGTADAVGLAGSARRDDADGHAYMDTFGANDRGGVGAAQDPAMPAPPRPGAPSLTQAEYLKAARDLLALGNLPLHDKDGEVFASNLALQTDLKAARQGLVAARAALQSSETKVQALQNSSQCAICLQGPEDGVPVNVALLPCGHVFCAGCSARLRQCATCKRAITGTLTVYL